MIKKNVIHSLEQIRSPELFFYLNDFLPHAKTYLKIEGLNVAGSIKLKTAISLLNDLENREAITSKTTIIESSSGNLGVALSILCKERGYPFICITDPNISLRNEALIKVYGGQIIKVTKKDQCGGYLQSRLSLIENLLTKNGNYVWTNQYNNPANCAAHYQMTAQEIIKQFPIVDYLFIGTGTTGTLTGCATYFKQNSPETKIIAVEPEGSITFGGAAKTRYIPGIGTSRKPEIADARLADKILFCKEIDTIQMCHQILAKYNLLLGGSTGSVLSALKQYEKHIKPNSVVIAISPDLGESYINTIYNKKWINKYYVENMEQEPV